MGMTNTVSKRTEEMVYIWVEDGEMSLNVELIARFLVMDPPGFRVVDPPCMGYRSLV